MSIKEEVIEFMDRSDYRVVYNTAVSDYLEVTDSDQEFHSYDDFVKNMATIIEDNNGDIDDAVAMFDDTISNFQSFLR